MHAGRPLDGRNAIAFTTSSARVAASERRSRGRVLMHSLTASWRRLAAAAAIVLAATACGSSGSGGGSSAGNTNGPVTLTMWFWGQQEAHGLSTFVAQSVKKYETLHPNITIKTVLQSTDNLMPNFAAAAKAKKGPDIEYRWGGIWALQDAWD